MSDYRVQNHEQQNQENLETIVRGFKAILRDGGFRRGTAGTLAAALGQHVSLSFILTVDFLKKQSAALGAEGIEIVFHDDEGRDVELQIVR